MNKWTDFLDSLHSPGGQLLILCLFVCALLGLVIWVTSRDAGDSQATTVIVSTFSAFSGALLGFLTGRSSAAQTPPNTIIVPPVTKLPEPKV